MTYEELKESVVWGEEYNFYFNNEEFWITQNKEGYYLTRGDNSYQEFKTSEELFKNARIGGKLIIQIWDWLRKAKWSLR